MKQPSLKKLTQKWEIFKMIKLPLAEQPHFVFQGEGRYAGQKMLLLRVQGCTLNCPWCDSKHTWKMPEEKHWIDIDEYLNDKVSNKIMITGGQPSLYIEQIADLVDAYPEIDFYIEDDGSYDWSDNFNPIDKNVYFTFSPKIDNGLQFAQRNYNYLKNVDLKFVVTSAAAIQEVAHFAETFGIDKDNIWIMPQGETRAELFSLIDFLCDKTLVYGFNFTIRNHIFIYNKKRYV